MANEKKRKYFDIASHKKKNHLQFINSSKSNKHITAKQSAITKLTKWHDSLIKNIFYGKTKSK